MRKDMRNEKNKKILINDSGLILLILLVGRAGIEPATT